jgi:hypothetical protein
MRRDRLNMSVRVVPGGSREAGDARVGGTPEERLALVHKLSEMMWTYTGRPLPAYSRATMPVVRSSVGNTARR